MATCGQAIGIARLFTSLIAGAFLFILFNRITTPILTHADNRATTPMGQNGNEYLTILLENMPFILAAIAFFGLIALAVYQSELT